MRKYFLLVIPALLLLGGCLSPEQKLVGKYKGKIETNRIVKTVAPMADAFTSMVEPQLDLRPDKTFVLSVSMAPIEGTWKLEDKVLILTPKTMMGMSTDEVKKKAEKEFGHAQKELDRMKKDSPIPIPFSMDGGMPNMTEMKVSVDLDNQKLGLDPAGGTFLAGFGKIIFTKV